MCGFAGIVYFDRERRVSRELLDAMCDTIVHRGPDDRGLYVDGTAGLGSTRLSIIDVAGGHMPLSNEDGSIWIAFNGEVYNFQSLRRRLQGAGHRFASQTDTEAIVHLYEEEGLNFPKSLSGMFGLAIWDSRRRRLILARDHVGIKPVYYAQSRDGLVFASELKALLAAGVDRTIDPVALHDYLSLNYVPGPRTMFTAVRKLLPGHMLVCDVDDRQVRVEQFWDYPRTGTSQPARSLQELEQDVLNRLREAVRAQMISDVPL